MLLVKLSIVEQVFVELTNCWTKIVEYPMLKVHLVAGLVTHSLSLSSSPSQPSLSLPFGPHKMLHWEPGCGKQNIVEQDPGRGSQKVLVRAETNFTKPRTYNLRELSISVHQLNLGGAISPRKSRKSREERERARNGVEQARTEFCACVSSSSSLGIAFYEPMVPSLSSLLS